MEDGEHFAELFNLGEAGLWFAISTVIAWKLRNSPHTAKFNWLLPPTFIVFGISDFIESRTGAFWDLWWLLVMKSVCVVVVVIVDIRYRRERVRAKAVHPTSANTSTSTPLDPRT